jgi:hypothetical protein
LGPGTPHRGNIEKQLVILAGAIQHDNSVRSICLAIELLSCSRRQVIEEQFSKIEPQSPVCGNEISRLHVT